MAVCSSITRLSFGANMKIVFFGTPAFAGGFLKGLLQEPSFEVVGVVTQPDEPVGRKKILTAPPVKIIALEHQIPVFQPTKLKSGEFPDQLKALHADLAVVVAYGRLLPLAMLNSLPLGFINVHPSLLPKYRGPSPIVAAIANGDSETAVSVMKLVPDMDAGPILGQLPLTLDTGETVETLTAKIVKDGVPYLIKTLQDYAQGSITPTEQDHTQATYCTLLTREHGVIDWTESAETIERKVRAYNPWPGTSTTDLKIFAVAFSDRQVPAGERVTEGGRLFIGTGTTALEILELQAAGSKRMRAADFLRGHKL